MQTDAGLCRSLISLSSTRSSSSVTAVTSHLNHPAALPLPALIDAGVCLLSRRAPSPVGSAGGAWRGDTGTPWGSVVAPTCARAPGSTRFVLRRCQHLNTQRLLLKLLSGDIPAAPSLPQQGTSPPSSTACPPEGDRLSPLSHLCKPHIHLINNRAASTRWHRQDGGRIPQNPHGVCSTQHLVPPPRRIRVSGAVLLCPCPGTVLGAGGWQPEEAGGEQSESPSSICEPGARGPQAARRAAGRARGAGCQSPRPLPAACPC